MKIRGKLILSFYSVTLLMLLVFGVITYFTFVDESSGMKDDLYETKAAEVALSVENQMKDSFNRVNMVVAKQAVAGTYSDHNATNTGSMSCQELIKGNGVVFDSIFFISFDDHGHPAMPVCQSEKPNFDSVELLKATNKVATKKNEPTLFWLNDLLFVSWVYEIPLGKLHHSDSHVLVAKININYFKNMMDSLNHIQDSLLMFFFKERELCRVAATQKDLFDNFKLARNVSAIQKGKITLFQDGFYTLASGKTFLDLDLFYIIPSSVYFKNLVHLKNRVIAAVLVLSWVAIWVVLILAFRISKPISNLAKATNDMTIMNYSTPLEFKDSKDEIGMLARSFETMRQQIEELVTIDPLTKTYNRRYLMHNLDIVCAQVQRFEENLAIIMLDIDFFKKVNDTYGHQAGDEVLEEIGAVLMRCTRSYDTVAANSTVVRYGGEEFIILLPKNDAQNASLVAERIRKTVENHEMKNKLRCTVSLGVSSAKGETNVKLLPMKLIEMADQALYEAKNAGRNRTFIHLADNSFEEVVPSLSKG